MRRFTSRLKISAISVLTALAVAVFPVAAYSDTISDLIKEQEEIEKKKQLEKEKKKEEQSKLNEATRKADAISDDMDEVEGEMEEVDEALVENIATIELIEDDIAAKEIEIEETTKEYEEAKKTEEDQYEAMKLRIKYMYEKGDYTYVQLLVESQGFSDLVNKVEYVEKLYEYDRRLLIEYQEIKQRTLELKEQLEEEKSELDTTLLELEEEKKILNEQLAEKQKQYESFSARLKEAQNEAAIYRANVEKQNAAIKKLEEDSSRKQKQIEDAKRAEEEAKKAAEEARKKEGGSKSYASASSFNSGSTGERIAQYALQFVGNPYVYGGTSLTNGADCSGFVMTVYKDFGYKIPRTGMKNIGTGVDYENARPGDIVCYAGHVAIYIGNGRIVHASSARTGIKVSNATYKPIVAIRRVV